MSTAVTANNTWSTMPPVGDLDAYIKAVNRMPMLTPQEELMYADQMRDADDLQAAAKLVMSHLRLVVATARNYLAYGLPHGDLIQEGNVGLMKAVKRFDPSQGARLATYALHWIKAEIHEYILKNWRMVRLATTKAQRKLFFNLRSMKHRLQQEATESSDHAGAALTGEQLAHIASALNVKVTEVAEMETRMGGEDVCLDPLTADDGESPGFGPIHYLTDSSTEPTQVIEARRRDYLISNGIPLALDSLDPRSRRIMEQRWLNVKDDGSGGLTLQDLAAEYGVSAERIRQIEASAMKKMRSCLAAYA